MNDECKTCVNYDPTNVDLFDCPRSCLIADEVADHFDNYDEYLDTMNFGNCPEYKRKVNR